MVWRTSSRLRQKSIPACERVEPALPFDSPIWRSSGIPYSSQRRHYVTESSTARTFSIIAFNT